MTLSSTHPLYDEYLEDWEQMRHVTRGERIVKEESFRYLPATSGMIEDGLLGTVKKSSAATAGTTTSRIGAKGMEQYKAYKRRARFPGLTKGAVKKMLGIMHRKPAVIELPERLEGMRDQATLRRESLQMLLKRINREQLITGRLGLLLDLPPELPAGVTPATVVPYIATYKAETIRNWDDGRRDGTVLDNLNLVVLDESERERDEFAWEEVTKYRVLMLGELQDNEPQGGSATYSAGVFRDKETFNQAGMTPPVINGNPLNFIPFTFINAADVVPDPDEPPLLELSNDDLGIYRGEADYRQSLFMQGQDTLVISGVPGDDDKTYRVGANATLLLPTGAQAEYIGVDSEGLSEQRQALENDYQRAGEKGGSLIEATSRERESGDALKIRVSSRTADMLQIVLVGAFGLELCLKQAAVWVGADPDQVKVMPNVDFVDDLLLGKEVVDLMTGKRMGAPLSLRSIHKNMQDRGLTEMDFEEELEAIEEEEDLLPEGSTNPNGPQPDDDDPDNPDDPDDGGNDE